MHELRQAASSPMIVWSYYIIRTTYYSLLTPRSSPTPLISEDPQLRSPLISGRDDRLQG